jgi:hypothetical protein
MQKAVPRLRKSGLNIHNFGRLARNNAATVTPKLRYLKRYEGRTWLYGCFAFAENYPLVFDVLFQSARHDFHQNLWAMDFLAQQYFVSLSDTKSELVLLDEGYIQRGVTALFNDTTLEKLSEYIEAVPVSDVLIMVDTPIDLAISRASARKNGIPKVLCGSDDIATAKNLATFATRLEYCKERQRALGAHIIDLDGSQDLDTNVATLKNELTAIS